MKLGKTTLGATAAFIALMPCYRIFIDRNKVFIPHSILDALYKFAIMPHEWRIFKTDPDYFVKETLIIALFCTIIGLIFLSFQIYTFYEQQVEHIGISFLSYSKRTMLILVLFLVMRFFMLQGMQNPGFLIEVADRKAAGAGALLYAIAPGGVVLFTFLLGLLPLMLICALSLWRDGLISK